MKSQAALALLAAAGLALAGCETHDGMAANGKICASWKTATAAPATVAGGNAAAVPGAPMVDAASPVDECVKHWAYSLASSRDGADVVADAAVAACGTALTNWNQGAMSGPMGSEQAVSVVTGQPTNPMAEHAAFARNMALLYVVEARAGRCKPPEVVNGAPVGA